MIAILRALTPIFGRNNRPTRLAVRAIVDKFDTKFTLLDVPVPKRRLFPRSEEIIVAVSASIENEPNQSTPRRSKKLGIAQTTLWRVVRKDLGLHVWCGFHAGSVIGPYFFVDENDRHVIVNG